MNKTIISIIGSIAIIFLANCSSTDNKNEIQGNTIGSTLDFKSLSRKDYKVLSTVTGEASFTRTRILVFVFYSFGLPGLTGKHSSGNISSAPSGITPFSPLDYTKQTANYNAIEKLPNADAILQPRYTTSCEKMQALIYSEEKCTVKATGKAIAIIEG